VAQALACDPPGFGPALTKHTMSTMVVIAALLLALISNIAFSQENDPVLHVGNGVTPPRVLHKVDPVFSKEAEREKIQGTAFYSIVVDKSGKPRNIELLSPLGYGLDEKGIEAIGKWVFAPGMKDGMPVNVLATIEINFRLGGISFDSKTEERRTSCNTAIHNLQIADKKAKGLETVVKLAADKYPPAMSLLGGWMIEGNEVPKDVLGGIDLIRKAVDKYDGSGLYELGILSIEGKLVPAEPEKGLKLIREASTNGNRPAQLYLGLKYESGDAIVPVDRERARYYFRLCAARSVAACQFHLGKLLMPAPGETKGDPVQAVAWLELARDGSVQEAEPLALSLRDNLSPEDIRRVEKLKPQLLRP
jgi:TonB family protein